MNRQEMFDKAARGVLAQGRPSHRPDLPNQCLYAGPDDCACNVGHLLDPNIRHLLDHRVDSGFDKIIDDYDHGDETLPPLPDWFTDPDNFDFLGELQAAHDNASVQESGENFISEYGFQMTRLANAYGLSTEVLERV